MGVNTKYSPVIVLQAKKHKEDLKQIQSNKDFHKCVLIEICVYPTQASVCVFWYPTIEVKGEFQPRILI